MADKTVNIWVKIKGNAEKSLKAVGTQLGVVDKKADKAGSSFKKLAGAVGGLVVINKANQWMKESVRLAQEQERASARLVSIAKGVTGATDEEIKSLQDLALSYQDLSTFGNEVLEAGQSQILSFGATAAEAGLLTRGLTDLLAANNGVNATQEDAINAANMFGKALGGQAGALSRVGILLDERQTKLIQEGDQATRVNTLIEVMDANYGGLAKTLSETSSGQIEQMENSIGDLREEMGEALLPAVLDVKTAMFDFYSVILDNEGTILASVKTVAQLISDTIVGWNHLLGGEERAAKAAKNFEIVGKEIAFYKANVMLAADSLAVLEERGITTGSEYERFTRTFEENNDALVASLTYLDELKAGQKGAEIQVSATNGVLKKQATALDESTESMKKNSEGLSFWVDRFRMLPQEGGGTEGGLLMQAILGNHADDEALLQERKDMAIDIAQQTAQGIAMVASAVNNSKQQEHDNEVKRQKEEVNNSNKSAKQKAKALKKIDEQASKDRLKLRLSEWRQNLVMSIVNTALAVTSALPNIPKSVSVGALGVASTIVIAANKPKAYHGLDVKNKSGMKGDVNEVLVRDKELILNPNDAAEYKANKGATNGAAPFTYAPTINVPAEATEATVSTFKGMLEESARIVEDMFVNNSINPGIINQALAQ